MSNAAGSQPLVKILPVVAVQKICVMNMLAAAITLEIPKINSSLHCTTMR